MLAFTNKTFFQGHYFEKDHIALPGLAKFFKKSSDEEREHAQMFMKVSIRTLSIILLQVNYSL